MVSKRLRQNTIALSVTFSINFTLCMIIAFKAGDHLFWIGLGFAPVFGGIFRSMVAYKKDVAAIIVIMFVLDSFVLIPLINNVWDYGFGGDYGDGILMGVIAGTIMAVVGFITLLVRHTVEKDEIKKEHVDTIIQ